ncbi:PREDICTED: uncharacterized protein LOC104801126 isoform X3 [Tarenaya hassleriana]|uniref:uncharacterized protein LOC104801126 isoform X3 n=1 Tax=Tarenaya hassleriana TaxID=28532 RepID=UPI00053C0BC2|nr:PREDICTED: uncharacterized protein LOC104801126 isoform X3 [Tarenaya hassleriana]
MEPVSTEHGTMEPPAAALRSSLGKRKAEIQDLKDSDGEVEKGGSSSPTETTAEHSEDDDSKELEWGYDSFDGLEYASPRDYGFSDDESYQKFRRYMRQYYVYKGFYIDPKNIQPCQGGGIGPYTVEELEKVYVAPGKTKRQQMEELAEEALQKYNQINGTNVTFEKLVRVNISWSTISRVYITLLVKENPDKPDEPSVEYQAKVQKRIGEKYQPIFCRPAPFQVKRIAD